MDGGRLLLMLWVGFLLLEVALTGRLGSIIGSFIDPASMVEGTPGTDQVTNWQSKQGVAGG